MNSSLLKHAAHWACCLAVVWMGMAGLHRGLWLDEAWVANSIRANSLAEMFWGGEWLQTSPPLFLLAARAAVAVFGLSTETLRGVSLFFALLAAVAIIGAAKRDAPNWSGVASAAVMFPGVAPEYFGSFKQYGAEAAAAAVVLWATVEYRRVGFPLYCALVTGLLTLAYPLAFLVPGLVLWMWRTDGSRRALLLAGSCATMLGALYWWFIRPNVEPSLWIYWGQPDFSPSAWRWAAAVIALTAWAAWKRNPVALACALPCVLLTVAEFTGWYPTSPRMSLFIRPCFVLGAVFLIEEYLSWKWIPALAILLSLAAAVSFRSEPFEDYPAAVSYLRTHLAPGDLLLVHPDARQGLLLYAAIEHWEPPATYATTGWPCCARGHIPAKSTDAAVRADLATLVPADFRARVWLFYANRPLHWDYIGLNEGELWRKILWDRGCPPADYIALPNLVISPMQCVPRGA